MNKLKYLLIVLIVPIIQINCRNDDEDIASCIDSKHHKESPTKEDNLHQQCKPWKDYSCCNENTTLKAHDIQNHYNFNLNHCPNHPMSDECRQHFTQDLCFYECEPYVKPWLVQVNRTFASQRIYNVPICGQDCDHWWHDCQHDYTCTANWARNFNWTDKSNQCPPESQCIQMKDMYSGAKQFCETVWDHSWKYAADGEPCMKMLFVGSNPNKDTARHYARITSASNDIYLTNFISFLAVFVCFIIYNQFSLIYLFLI